MTTPVMLIAALVVAIAIILFCIIVLKLNAAIGLAIASLFMGVAGGLDLLTTVDTVSSRLRQHDDQYRSACRFRYNTRSVDE